MIKVGTIYIAIDKSQRQNTDYIYIYAHQMFNDESFK